MRGFRVAVAMGVLLAGGCTGSSGESGSVSSLPTPTTPAPAPTSTTAAPAQPAAGDDPYVDDRLAMVENQIEPRDIDPAVLEAMRTVPRHEFVPEELVELAYQNRPLPIGYGQTISQPAIVAIMSDLVDVEPGNRVLEIGTGSGYQAAVLAAMGVDVYTIEIIPELAAEAATRLGALGYEVTTQTADGYFGWEDHAPFDAIIVTAAPDHVPQPLVNQLAPGGRMVIPVGPVGTVQTMWRFTVDDTGELIGENFGQVFFVPFTRDEPAA